VNGAYRTVTGRPLGADSVTGTCTTVVPASPSTMDDAKPGCTTGTASSSTMDTPPTPPNPPIFAFVAA
jgi:hypothetical protein